jgi:hypothetical protein
MSARTSQPDTLQVKLRVPKYVVGIFEALAESNQRSLDAQFTHVISEYVKEMSTSVVGECLIEGAPPKRELFAAMAMQALIAKVPLMERREISGKSSTDFDAAPAAVADGAIAYADALVARLALNVESHSHG